MTNQLLVKRLHDVWSRMTPPKQHLLSDAINVIDNWDGPGRQYHNQTHLADVLAKLDWAREKLFDSAELAYLQPADRSRMFDRIELALFYHDVIYNARAKDNEAQSRDLFLVHAEQQQLPQADRDAIARLIDMTANHTTAKEMDECIMADCDLAILGAERKAFEAYDRQIMQEYSHVPAAIARPRRAAVMKKFLDAPRLFKTDLFHQEFDARARANLATITGTQPSSPIRKILHKFGF